MLHLYGINEIIMAIMKNYLFSTIALLLLFSTLLVAQKEKACDCLCDFEYLKHYVETNHPGFKDQVTNENEKRYEQYADSIRQLIKKGEQPCLPLLRGYTAFIRIVPGEVARAFAVGVASVMLAAVLPALRVTRVPIVEALRRNL